MLKYNTSLTLKTGCLLCGLVLTSFSLQAATPKRLAVLDRMVASVNNEAITESELNRQTQLLSLRLQQTDTTLPPLPVLHKQLLEKMILEKLQLQLAAEEGIEVETNTLNETIEDIASRDGLSVHQMQQFLEEQGISPTQFRETIKTEMTLGKLQQKEVGQHITISKAEIENFIKSSAFQDHSGTEYHLGHILISLPDEENPSKEQIQKLQERSENTVKELKSGANFAKTAIAKSAGQQALNGGDLGWRKIAEIPTTFAKIVSALQVGEIYGPIRDNSGFHIIKLLHKRNTEADLGKKIIEETHLRQILIKTNEKKSDKEAEATLTKLREQIISGASFEKLAKKYSEEASATQGGDIGWVTAKHVVPTFNQQIASLKSGEISQPFKTELGWHLIQVLEKRTQQASSEAMRSKALEILYQRKFDESLVTWLRHLRAESEVKIYLDES